MRLRVAQGLSVVSLLVLALLPTGACSTIDQDATSAPVHTPLESPQTTPTPADCAQLQAAWVAGNRGLIDLQFEHPRQVVTGFGSALAVLEPVVPPEGIASPWQDFIDYLRRVTAALEPIDPSDSVALAAAYAEAISEDETARAASAAEQINAFFAAGC